MGRRRSRSPGSPRSPRRSRLSRRRVSRRKSRTLHRQRRSYRAAAHATQHLVTLPPVDVLTMGLGDYIQITRSGDEPIEGRFVSAKSLNDSEALVTFNNEATNLREVLKIKKPDAKGRKNVAHTSTKPRVGTDFQAEPPEEIASDERGDESYDPLSELPTIGQFVVEVDGTVYHIDTIHRLGPDRIVVEYFVGTDTKKLSTILPNAQTSNFEGAFASSVHEGYQTATVVVPSGPNSTYTPETRGITPFGPVPGDLM